MADYNTDKKRIAQKSKLDNEYTDVEGELLHDYVGNQYLLSDSDYKQQLEQRANSEIPEQDLQLARELLHSNLRQLTERQKDVMYYTMQGWPQSKIAKKLSISQTSVSQHLQAARVKLAKLIKTTKEVMNDVDRNDNETNV